MLWIHLKNLINQRSLGICLSSRGSMLQPEICFANYGKSLLGPLIRFCEHTAVTTCESHFAFQRIPKNNVSWLKTPGKCSPLGTRTLSALEAQDIYDKPWDVRGYEEGLMLLEVHEEVLHHLFLHTFF